MEERGNRVPRAGSGVRLERHRLVVIGLAAVRRIDEQEVDLHEVGVRRAGRTGRADRLHAPVENAPPTTGVGEAVRVTTRGKMPVGQAEAGLTRELMAVH